MNGTVSTPVLVAILALLAGCVRTSYRASSAAAGAAAGQETSLQRQVDYHLDRGLYRDPPGCVFLAPPPAKTAAGFADLVERAVARQLGERFRRTISPQERRRRERRDALDLNHAGDRAAFARRTRCPAYVRWRTVAASSDFALVLAQRRVGFEVELRQSRDDKLLWQAAHVASRWDGGLPMSPLSLPFAAFRAATLSQDPDVLHSMVDDALRRLFATLPSFI
jgi:hypothetical protein